MIRILLIVIAATLAAMWFGFSICHYSSPKSSARVSYIDLAPPCSRPYLSRRDERAVCAMQAAAADYGINRANGRHP